MIILKSNLQLNTDAVKIRYMLGVNSVTPIDIFAIINSMPNYTLVFYPMSDRISGMCIKEGESNIVAINSKMSYGRQRFTVTHELYHLLIERTVNGVVCEKQINGPKHVSEMEADIFASYVLAPNEALEIFIEQKHFKDKTKWIIDDIIEIEQYFQMSHQAMLIRLLRDGFITEKIAKGLQSGIIQKAKKLGYDDILYLHNDEDKEYFTIGEYIKKAELVRDKDLISDGKYEELLLDGFRSDMVYGSVEEGINLND